MYVFSFEGRIHQQIHEENLADEHQSDGGRSTPC